MTRVLYQLWPARRPINPLHPTPVHRDVQIADEAHAYADALRKRFNDDIVISLSAQPPSALVAKHIEGDPAEVTPALRGGFLLPEGQFGLFDLVKTRGARHSLQGLKAVEESERAILIKLARRRA
jgi:hypothetical protein